MVWMRQGVKICLLLGDKEGEEDSPFVRLIEQVCQSCFYIRVGSFLCDVQEKCAQGESL